MNILYKSVIPVPLLESSHEHSDIWGKEVEFRENEKYVVVSPSGLGKSTLLSILYGIRNDYEGDVFLEGESLRKINRKSWAQLRTSSLSIVFQGLNLFDDLTAIENIEIKNNLTGYKSLAEIETFCEQLGISQFLSKKAGKMSFGQKQRIAIVRALCQPFRFLLLDEPFSHLDPENTDRALSLLSEEAKIQGAGIIMTSVGNTFDGTFKNILRL